MISDIAKRFNLDFKLANTPPVKSVNSEESSYLVLNPCDGWRIVEVSFYDGKFDGFHEFGKMYMLHYDSYQFWAEIPLSLNTELKDLL